MISYVTRMSAKDQDLYKRSIQSYTQLVATETEEFHISVQRFINDSDFDSINNISFFIALLARHVGRVS